jgi:hypothetical protein
MFADTMSAAIDAARTLTRLDHLSRDIWRGLSAGAVGDDAAQSLAERLHARRSVLRGEIKPVGIPPGRPSIFPPRRPQRAPARPVAIARRRHLAASGPMPPALACKFTVSELAVLRIVGDEVTGQGACALTLAEVAARAGTCRRMAQSALRQAAGLGLVTIQERRREGQKNLPNVIRVVSREWLQWLRIGCKKSAPTVREFKNPAASTREKGNRPAATPPNFARGGPPSAAAAEGSRGDGLTKPRTSFDARLDALIAGVKGRARQPG